MATFIFQGDDIHTVTAPDIKVTGFDSAGPDITFHSGTGRTAVTAGQEFNPHLGGSQDSTDFDEAHTILRVGDKLQLHTALTGGETYDAEIVATSASNASLVIDDVKDPLTFGGVAAVEDVVADVTLIAQINFTTVDSNEPSADLTGDEIVDIVITYTPPGFGAGYTETETIFNQPGYVREEYSASNNRVVLYFDNDTNRDAFVAKFDGSTQAQGGAAVGTDIDVTIHYHDTDAITHYSYAKAVGVNFEASPTLTGQFITCGPNTKSLILSA